MWARTARDNRSPGVSSSVLDSASSSAMTACTVIFSCSAISSRSRLRNSS